MDLCVDYYGWSANNVIVCNTCESRVMLIGLPYDNGRREINVLEKIMNKLFTIVHTWRESRVLVPASALCLNLNIYADEQISRWTSESSYIFNSKVCAIASNSSTCNPQTVRLSFSSAHWNSILNALNGMMTQIDRRTWWMARAWRRKEVICVAFCFSNV